MALLGEVFSAQEGLAHGIVDVVVAKGQSLKLARDFAARISSRGPLATQATKMLINAAEGDESASTLEALAGGFAAGSDEIKAGVEAFRNKRKADF